MSDEKKEIEVEVWVIRGRVPCLWTIPAYVIWNSRRETGEIKPAVALLRLHREHLDQMLKVVATYHNGKWYIRRYSLEQIASMVIGTDPEKLFSWEQRRMAQEACYEPEKRKERDEFLDHLYQSGCGSSRDEVEKWWHQLCNGAMDWLINKEKPVDMYFVMLHPSVYRQNWRYILLSRFPKLGPILCHKTGIERDWILQQSGLLHEMMSLDLLAMVERKGHCYRHVEVEHRSIWWKTILKTERTRIDKLGVYDYAQTIFDSVKRRLPATIRIYLEFLAGSARPSAANIQPQPQDSPRLVAVKPDDWIWEDYSGQPVPSIIPNDIPPFKPASPTPNLFGKNGILPPMSIVQPTSKDVWYGRKKLPRWYWEI